MASGSALGVDSISDSSNSSSETDSDSDGNMRFSEFDSDSGSDDDAFLGFGEPGDTPVFTWDKSNGPRPNPIPDFDYSNTGPTNNLNAEATALDFFSLFIDDAMLLRWCDFTEMNAAHKRASDPNKHKGEWSKPSLEKMKTFLAICITINNGLEPCRIEMLWVRKPDRWLYHTPGFWRVMTEKRFHQIKRYLQVSKPITDGSVSRDRLSKVRSFLTDIQARFAAQFVPSEFVAIDECMIPFKGRWRGKQYIRAKPVKWGIKVDILADWRTGYNCFFRIYTGKVTVPDNLKHLGVLGYLVATLSAPIENRGYKLALDQGYSSPKLFDYLASRGIGAAGTVQSNRVGYPKGLIVKKTKTKRGEWDWFRSGNLLAVRWCDKSPIYFISNYHYPDDQQVTRRNKVGVAERIPATSAVVVYNNHMHAVDKLDQNTVLDKSRKQYKWYMRLVLKMVEWSIFNAFVLEQESRRSHGITGEGHRKRDMLSFRQDLGMQLIGEHRISVTRKRLSAVAPTEDRLNVQLLHIPVVGEGRDHTCLVCYERHRRFKKRNPGVAYKDNPLKAVKKTFMCQTCNAYLCIKKDSDC